MKRTPQRLAIKVKYLIMFPSMRVICQKPFLTSQFQVATSLVSLPLESFLYVAGPQFAPGISAVVTTLIPHVSVVVVPAVVVSAYVLFTINQKETTASESAMKLSIFFINIC